jgi:hypothetical protein
MSDDIAARLRAFYKGHTAQEAADEIERLREQNADLRERVTMLVEAAAEDARRVSALEDIIAKRGPVL